MNALQGARLFVLIAGMLTLSKVLAEEPGAFTLLEFTHRSSGADKAAVRLQLQSDGWFCDIDGHSLDDTKALARILALVRGDGPTPKGAVIELIIGVGVVGGAAGIDLKSFVLAAKRLRETCISIDASWTDVIIVLDTRDP